MDPLAYQKFLRTPFNSMNAYVCSKDGCNTCLTTWCWVCSNCFCQAHCESGLKESKTPKQMTHGDKLEKDLIERGLKELEENQHASLEKYNKKMQLLIRQAKEQKDFRGDISSV